MEVVCDIDWLDFRGDMAPSKFLNLVEELVGRTDDILDHERSRPGGRHIFHQEIIPTARGARYGYSPSEDECAVWVSLPSKALAGADGVNGKVFIIKACLNAGLRCTRLDICMDEENGVLSALRSQIREAYKRGENSGFRDVTEIVGYKGGAENEEFTQYIGSRGSDSFSRIYDKSKTKQRWERQTRAHVSHEIASGLLSVHLETLRDPLYWDLLGEYLKSNLTGGIEFLIRRGKNLDRADRSPFWQEFLDWLSAAQFKIVRKPEAFDISRTMGWISRQCSRTLAMLQSGLGSDWADWYSTLLERGKRGFSKKHHEIVGRIKEDRRHVVAGTVSACAMA